MKLSLQKRFFQVIGIFSIVLLFTACEKSDNYIDWKVLNQDWYAQHKNDPGFTVTESGLCYKRVFPTQGANPADRMPNASDIVTVNYTGTFIDGLEFDKAENAMLHLPSEPAGFSEALVKMTQGEIYEFYVPYKIGYGIKGEGNIPPYTTLIYRVELLESRAY